MHFTENSTSRGYFTSSKLLTNSNSKLELFKKHWICTLKVMSKEHLSMDELEPVIYYMDQMLSLIIEENKAEDLKICGPIFKYSLDQDVFNKIYECTSKFMGEALERLKHQQLKLFSEIVSKVHPSLLHYKEILQPLLRLINSYSLRSSLKLELILVHLLQLICIRISNEPILQCLCKDIGVTILNDPLPLLNPLVPFLHRDGILGQKSKCSVLLLVALSRDNEEIAISVSLQSDFCPVLATGLSALYSALPRKLPAYCHSILLGQLNQTVIDKYQELQYFIEYLRFCCHVNEIVHPLVREAVLHYVYNGFLLPVIASSFHQNSVDEVITATIYFELFLRMITESGLLKAFLCFIIAENYDGYRLMDTLLNRLHSNTGLGVVTLSLMNTLISFHCEDVMFELIFRHLIPCQHLNLNNNSNVFDRECLKDAFEIFLELSMDPYHSDKVFNTHFLYSANKSLNICNCACEQSWQFDYDGVNPSPDYLDKVLDPVYVQCQKPFHGFLDHYAQLLEMRDFCRKQLDNSGTVSRQSTCTTPSFYLNGSCDSTPQLPISRNDSLSTVTSLKFDNDSRLAMCLQRLRDPTDEDLLEQKSHYILSYNVTDHLTDDDSAVISPQTSRRMDNYTKSFDLVRTVSNETIESQPEEAAISVEDIQNLVDSVDISEFIENLDLIAINPRYIRNINLSLDEVMHTITSIDERENRYRHSSENRCGSPDCSYMSLESALTIEDNILRNGNLPSNVRNSTIQDIKKTATVGLFLHTILERLERFHQNPFHINLQLTAIVISLLSFPQPLIRNFLLNPRGQLKVGIKCLYTVLTIVKSKLDESKIKINISKKDGHYFSRVSEDARSRLEKRIDHLANNNLESEEQIKICGLLPSIEPNNSTASKNEKRHFNLLDFLSRKSNHNDNQSNNGLSSSKHKSSKEDAEYVTHINLAFACIMFEEFCKEIASFCKEQYVFRR